MSRHQKRITVPVSWPIARKTEPWVAKTSPGPHSAGQSMPLLTVVRDMLHIVDNAREAKRILYEGKVLVDGRSQKDYKFPIGVFDVVSVPALNKHYRVLRDARGLFYFAPIDEASAKKLARIENKTFINGGKTQLNLSDGSNLLAEGEFKTGDSLVLSIPERKIEDRIELKEGNLAMVIGGKHTGQTGRIKQIKVVKSSRPNSVIISENGSEFETIVDYVYMIGRDAPVVGLGASR